MKSEKEVDDILKNSFQEVKADKSFIILLNGKRVRTRSGKSVWGNPGAAKNALNNHISSTGYWFKKEHEDLIKKWIEENIQIVSSADYEKAQRAIKSK